MPRAIPDSVAQALMTLSLARRQGARNCDDPLPGTGRAVERSLALAVA